MEILVVMPNGSMEIMNYTTESYTTWLEQVFLTVKNTQKWCCATETSDEVYSIRINSALGNTSPNF